MLFLLKRTWVTGLIALAVLSAFGISLRSLRGDAPPLAISPRTALLGVAVWIGVLGSDLLLHSFFRVTFGEPYRRRYRELAAVFRGQSTAAIVVGSAMAGIGEELLFRGLSTQPFYLATAAVVFGLLHHIRRSLWPFSLWAVWQGVLFAAAVYLTEALFVTMVAHFLHDLAGFAVFRYHNRSHT
ncbi:MAG: CPBP family intramembrane metalloprotease [Gemmataceae bacterium]|nr:CPBP family intramembrane metalloprotease [Gemmataceae bacterium]